MLLDGFFGGLGEVARHLIHVHIYHRDIEPRDGE